MCKENKAVQSEIPCSNSEKSGFSILCHGGSLEWLHEAAQVRREQAKPSKSWLATQPAHRSAPEDAQGFAGVNHTETATLTVSSEGTCCLHQAQLPCLRPAHTAPAPGALPEVLCGAAGSPAPRLGRGSTCWLGNTFLCAPSSGQSCTANSSGSSAGTKLCFWGQAGGEFF